MKKERNLPELYFAVIKKCVEKDLVNTYDFKEDLGLSENSIVLHTLKDLEFISFEENQQRIKNLPKGFSAYLAINSQKQSAFIAEKALQRSNWAISISAALLLVSIIFNIINLIVA